MAQVGFRAHTHGGDGQRNSHAWMHQVSIRTSATGPPGSPSMHLDGRLSRRPMMIAIACLRDEAPQRSAPSSSDPRITRRSRARRSGQRLAQLERSRPTNGTCKHSSAHRSRLREPTSLLPPSLGGDVRGRDASRSCCWFCSGPAPQCETRTCVAPATPSAPNSGCRRAA